MNGLIKLCGASLLAVCAGLLFKERNKDFSFAISVVAGVVLISGAIGCAEQIVAFVRDVTGGSAAAGYVPVLLKAVGFSVLTEISVGICKEAGEEGIAAALGLAGRCEIILLSLPYVRELVGVALGMLKK